MAFSRCHLIFQMLICMDLSYEFAASVFLPVLRKLIGFCLRPPPTDGESSDNARHIPSVSSLSTNASEGSFIDKLKNRRKDKVRVTLVRPVTHLQGWSTVSSSPFQVVISTSMKKALEMASALVKLTRKQHSYAFVEPSSHNDWSVTPSTSADGQEMLGAQQDQSITRPTHIRLAEEVFYHFKMNISFNFIIL